MASTLKNILSGKSPLLAVQSLRYIIAGGVAFTVDFLLLKILADVGVHYILSAAIAFTAGLTITYLSSIYWIFDRRKIKDVKVEFLIFAAIGLVGLGLTSVFIWIFTGLAGIHLLISKVLTAAIVTAWNFAAKKIALF